MPAAPRITTQDPSYSPTYNLSTTAPVQHAIPSSVRRNLFSAHLSRRPVSHVASTILEPPSPTHQNVSPRQDVFSSGPTLHPTKRMMDLKDIYDPEASPPNHNASTSAVSNLFPRESIIAVNPLTGRPLLPNLPTLPARLRLSEGDEDDEEEEAGSDGEIVHRGHLEYGRSYTRSPSHARSFMPLSDYDFDPDIDLDSSDLNFIGISRRQNPIHDFMDPTDTEENRRDRERIERLLAEMMSRQRARARTLDMSDSSTAFGTSNATPAMATGSTRATRAGKARENRSENPLSKYDAQRSATEPTTGGVGATMDPLEKDELMGLIMTSLRRKLQQAEDESWMYGGAEGLGGIGMGAEAAGDGIYE